MNALVTGSGKRQLTEEKGWHCEIEKGLEKKKSHDDYKLLQRYL